MLHRARPDPGPSSTNLTLIDGDVQMQMKQWNLIRHLRLPQTALANHQNHRRALAAVGPAGQGHGADSRVPLPAKKQDDSAGNAHSDAFTQGE